MRERTKELVQKYARLQRESGDLTDEFNELSAQLQRTRTELQKKNDLIVEARAELLHEIEAFE